MGATPWHLAGNYRPIQNIMKTTVTSYQFVEAFRACGRETQFSRPALFALFEYLEDYEDSCGVELELDPVGICCEWAEHDSAILASKEYGQEFSDEEEALEWLRDHTQVVEFEGGVVIQLF
jgi:hypothetical protein